VTWRIYVNAALPRAARGSYAISVELTPADDPRAGRRRRSRAPPGGGRGGKRPRRRGVPEGYGAVRVAANAAAAAGDATLAAEATYQGGRQYDLVGDVPGSIEIQKRALEMFRELHRPIARRAS
jgi:hypothetical protein